MTTNSTLASTSVIPYVPIFAESHSQSTSAIITTPSVRVAAPPVVSNSATLSNSDTTSPATESAVRSKVEIPDAENERIFNKYVAKIVKEKYTNEDLRASDIPELSQKALRTCRSWDASPVEIMA